MFKMSMDIINYQYLNDIITITKDKNSVLNFFFLFCSKLLHKLASKLVYISTNFSDFIKITRNM